MHQSTTSSEFSRPTTWCPCTGAIFPHLAHRPSLAPRSQPRQFPQANRPRLRVSADGCTSPHSQRRMVMAENMSGLRHVVGVPLIDLIACRHVHLRLGAVEFLTRHDQADALPRLDVGDVVTLKPPHETV